MVKVYKMELGPEMTKLWDRLEAMNTKNFHADWGDGSYASVEERAKQINSALDQIENGHANIVTDEELKREF
jgi:hypothetical protein